METIHKVVDAAARTIYGSESYDEETKPTTQDGKTYKPTEHQIRDETTATPPPAEHRLPTQGPGKAVYSDKPIVTTTSETSKLSEESPSFENLSLRSSSPPSKDTAASGHRRVDSGIAEAEDIAERSTTDGVQHGAHQRYGYENVDDDGIQRTAGQIDAESHTTEGYPRPKFVGQETSEDGVRRADGRDRVQFDNPAGSTGNLKPSGEPGPERRRQGSAGELPYMDLGKQENSPPGARVGTVQGGTARDRQKELEDAQKAQSGGFGGTPVVFGTGAHDPTGTAQVQNQEYHKWCKPEVKKSTKDSNLRQVKAVTEDLTQTKIAENYPKPEPKYSELPGYISERDKGKRPQEDRCLQGQLAQEKPNSQSTQKTDGSHSNADTGDTHPGAETDGSPRGAETHGSHRGAETDGSHRGVETDNFHPDAKTDSSHHETDNDPKQPHSTTQTSPPSTASPGPQRSVEHPSSSNQPHSEKGTTNAATTNAVSPVGPGLTEGTHGPVDPSVGADPAHAQQPTQKHEGADRPTEEPKVDAPQPRQGKEGSQASQGEEKKKEEAGHKWVKSTGTAAEGGDFDAAKPGAGKEADRLLELAGVHRTTDPKEKKKDAAEPTKAAKGAHHGSTDNKADPKHHPDSAADGEKKGGLHLPGILHHHHHHDRQKDTAGHEDGSGHHKSLGGKLEKIKEKVKPKKDSE